MASSDEHPTVTVHPGPGERVAYTVAPGRTLSYFVPEEPRRVSNSELAAFKWCQRNWWLTYYRKLGPIRDDDALSASGLGGLVHTGLEVFYAGGSPEEAISAVTAKAEPELAALKEAGEVERAAKLAARFELARIMLEGYFEWVEETGADDDLEVISAEEKHELPHPNLPGVLLLTKTDARVRRKSDDARLFIDHKTTDSLEKLFRLAYLQPQFRHYHLVEYLRWLADKAAGVENPGTFTAGVIINALRKVKRTKTAKPPFYGRHTINHNRALLLTHWQHVLNGILTVLDTERALDAGGDHQVLAPPSPSRDCDWRCPFVRVCPMFDDGSDPEAALTVSFQVVDPLERYRQSDDDEE